LKLLATAGALLSVSLASAAWRNARAPRALAVGEVPIAFWSWRADAPAEEDVERAAREAHARTLFIRAGQLDYEGGEVRRVRAVGGCFPRALELQLVYNATPSLLEEFERIGEQALAAKAVETFARDRGRASRDGARVAGLQLDLDVPTRQLSRYARVLKFVREQLPKDARLSITGLPTWMDSAELPAVLGAVDFWIPQFYGAAIPERLDRLQPISSPRGVVRSVGRARELGRPFYAGLAAYGYALLYARDGKLLRLRGDLDPSLAARDENLELIERRAFESQQAEFAGDVEAPTRGETPGEWRYVYRVREDGVIDGLVVRAGEHIVLDVPGSAGLRASVRGVREQAGPLLLGICIFRLPERGDQTTLSIPQVSSALADEDATAATRVSIERGGAEVGNELSNQMLLTATNTGAAGSLLGDDALVVLLSVPRGSVRGVASLDGFSSFETLCEGASNRFRASVEAGSNAPELCPCSPARASVVRLRARAWMGGAVARARISFEGDAPETFAANIRMQTDDGRTWRREQNLRTEEAGGR
jgi:hypothetical protein